jgi:hypothetical protein
MLIDLSVKSVNIAVECSITATILWLINLEGLEFYKFSVYTNSFCQLIAFLPVFLKLQYACNLFYQNWIYSYTQRNLAVGGPLMMAQWLRYCATNRKVAGSILDGVIAIFH